MVSQVRRRPNVSTHVATSRSVVAQNEIWMQCEQQKDCRTDNSNDRRQLLPVSHVLFEPTFLDADYIFGFHKLKPRCTTTR